MEHHNRNVVRRISAIRIGTAFLPLVLLFLITAAASDDCQPIEPIASPTSTPSRSVSPSRSPRAAIPPNFTPATVIRIVDGDTIRVLIDGEEFRVRYIGIDTPESVDPRRHVECFGLEASERNRQLIAGQTVGLERDVSETDDFGRLLRYVWLDGQMVNAKLVEEGYALAATYPPDVKYAATFAALQAQARDAGRGFWGATCGSTTPTPAAPIAAACEGGAPAIKGNISSEGERIYHVPGAANYDETVINETKGERWFCTEAEAVAAGWRKALS